MSMVRPRWSSRSTSRARRVEAPALRHGVDGVDHEIDDDLLQLGAVHQHQPCRALVGDDLDGGLVEQVPDQQQQIGDDVVRRVPLDIAGELLRLGELQQLGDDLADAVDLLVEQPELGPREYGTPADDAADDVEIALHDGHGIIDLVRHAGGDLADRGELLGDDELLGRRLQLAVGELELRACARPPAGSVRRSIRATGGRVPGSGRATRRGGWRPRGRSRRGPGGRSVRAPRSPLSTLGDRRRHSFQRPKDGARPSAGRSARSPSPPRRRRARMISTVAYLALGEGLLQEADIEHAHAPPVAVGDRLIGGDVPVVDDEGAFQPHPAFVESGPAHGRWKRACRARGVPRTGGRWSMIRTSSRNSVAVPWLPSGRVSVR